MNLLIIFGILTINVITNEAARILAVFPAPALSHQIYFRALSKVLADDGHELVVVTPHPRVKDEVPYNITEIDVHVKAYGHWKDNVFLSTNVKGSYVKTRLKAAIHGLISVSDIILQSEEVRGLIGQQFDLLILEGWVRPMMSFTHFFKTPVIRASSFGAQFDNLRNVGGLTHPILYPTSFPQRIYNLTFLETIEKLYYYYKVDIYHDYLEDLENEMLRRHYGAEFPSLSDLSYNTDCIFLNVHPIWESNRPVPINVIYMNGLNIKPPKELPENLKSYLDSSSNGVIYVSFGTTLPISVLSRDKVNIIIETLATMPYNVVWKWDNDTMDNKPDNFKISRWFPQADLLRHPNIKLFINQAGLQSTDEALAAGVPLIGFPMLGDQWLNAENYLKHGIGLQLNMGTITPDELETAINQIINEPSYKENIVKLHRLFLDQPMTSLERVCWWTDHILRHGATHLRAPAACLGVIDYHEIQLLSLVLVTCLIIICIFIGTTYAVIIYINKKTIIYSILITLRIVLQ